MQNKLTSNSNSRKKEHSYLNLSDDSNISEFYFNNSVSALLSDISNKILIGLKI